MRVGQKNNLVYQWAKTGSRPRQPKDQRYENAYVFGAVCPSRDTGVALIMPLGRHRGHPELAGLDLIARSGFCFSWRRGSADCERQSQGWHNEGVLPRADGEPHIRGSRSPLWHRHIAGKALS